MASLHIPRQLYEKVLADCKERYPYEACGIFSGIQGEGMLILSEWTELKNVSSAPLTQFESSPEQLIATIYRLQKQSAETVWFHSHPHAPAIPSSEDLGTLWSDTPICILSLTNFQIRAYKKAKKITAGQLPWEEIEVVVMSDD